MPTLRKIAKSLEKDASFSNEDKNAFLCNLPHEYYEENILHAIFLSGEKSFDVAIEKVEVFCRISTTGHCATLFRQSVLRRT